MEESEDERGRKRKVKKAKDRVGRNDRLSQSSGDREREEKGREERGQRRTEWAGMTD